VVYCVRQVAYFGSGDKVVAHFSSLGMHCAPHYNPADFISMTAFCYSYINTLLKCFNVFNRIVCFCCLLAQ